MTRENTELAGAVERVDRWANYEFTTADQIAVRSEASTFTAGDLRLILSALSAAPLHEGEGEPVGRNITFSPHDDETGNAVISPDYPDGPYWTLIAQGGDDRQNAVAAEICRRLNAAPPPSVEVFGSSAEGADTHRATDGAVLGWQTMENAPKDRPILGWCVHDADPYFLDDGKRLTLYGGHTEGLSHVADGAHVLVWGGAWDDRSHEYDGGSMPDWWFRSDSEFEVTANPVLWMDIPAPSEATTTITDEQVGTSVASEPNPSVEVERLREALTPSGDTKAAYSGEFKFQVTQWRENEDPDAEEEMEEYLADFTVPWTTIKEVMAAIAARAALSRKQEPGVQSPANQEQDQ